MASELNSVVRQEFSGRQKLFDKEGWRLASLLLLQAQSFCQMLFQNFPCGVWWQHKNRSNVAEKSCASELLRLESSRMHIPLLTGRMWLEAGMYHRHQRHVFRNYRLPKLNLDPSYERH